MENKIDEKVLNKLLKGAKTKIIATDNGIGIEGKLLEMLSLLGFLIRQIKDSGVDKNLLKETIRIGLGEKVNKTKESKDDEKLKHQKALKELLKGLNEALAKDLKDLEEMLGDEEDE